MSDVQLLARFVESFGKFDDLLVFDPVPLELDGGRTLDTGSSTGSLSRSRPM